MGKHQDSQLKLKELQVLSLELLLLCQERQVLDNKVIILIQVIIRVIYLLKGIIFKQLHQLDHQEHIKQILVDRCMFLLFHLMVVLAHLNLVWDRWMQVHLEVGLEA